MIVKGLHVKVVTFEEDDVRLLWMPFETAGNKKKVLMQNEGERKEEKHKRRGVDAHRPKHRASIHN